MPGPIAGAPESADIDAIVQGRHGDPFAVLGPHPVAEGCAVRVFVPQAHDVSVLAADGALLAPLGLTHPSGFWCGVIAAPMPYRLRLEFPGGVFETEDPYAFAPLLGDLDVHLLAEGRHLDFSAVLGAHVCSIGGVAGVRFAVWAPNARRVSVVGDFNSWDGRRHPMRLRHGPGVWELFIPRIGAGEIYKYEIVGPDGAVLPLRADPVAQATECPPRTGSVVPRRWTYVWSDADWMEGRGARQDTSAPISIYEVHAFSWRGEFLGPDKTWDDLADLLIPYVLRLGFTHVELMPVMEHPFGGSWGYQPLGQFAPTARLGAPEGFARFVDRCHGAGLGVLLDWVPAHFPTDAHGLACFDGTALYEHQDPKEGFHRDWNTLIYNLGRNEVRAFLIGSALFWLEHFHVDGLRVDAVASMLYRDYSRPEGEWVPNIYGGRENLEAISFLHELSRAVRARVPGAVLIAEESTAFPSVSGAVEEGGLGFDYKWNMGWMHDTLDYIEKAPVHRPWHHFEITFGMIYAYTEKFVLPLSHDEVVHGKRALIDKMPGDFWQQFANLRAYFGFMWAHPGKKLLFMGGEFAQFREWNHEAGLDWFLTDWPLHAGMQTWVADLNAAYRRERALHVLDTEGAGFAWVVLDDAAQSVFAFLRFGRAGDAPVLVVCNFTPVPRHGYRLGVPVDGVWHEILNSDARVYGGSDVGNGGAVMAEAVGSHGYPASLVLTLPPLATILLRAGIVDAGIVGAGIVGVGGQTEPRAA